MGLAIISLLTGLAISAVAIYYSVAGLTAIFAAAAVPIMVMGVALEVAKLVATVWLKQNWKIAPSLIKAYLVAAVGVLMFITSMGIFGFLSKAHSDQSLVSGDVQSKIAIYDEKIKTAKENIEANRRQLKQMDEAVDQVMARSTDEKGADKSNAIRRSQQRDRTALAKDIEANQKLIATLNDEAAPIRAEVRKVEAEVGPIKYIAAFVYGDNPDANILERAVTWVIVIIVFVFDPLAVVLLLAAQYSFARLGIAVGYEKEGQERLEEEREARLTLAQRLSEKIKGVRQYVSDSVDSLKSGFKSPLKKTEERPVTFNELPEDYVPPEGFIAQELADVVPEAVVVESSANILDDAKEKLALFVNELNRQEQEKQPEFAEFVPSVKGFEVPKVSNVAVPTEFANAKLNAPAMPSLNDDVPGGNIDAWNKLLEEAERAVEQENVHQAFIEKLPEEGVEGERHRVVKGGEEVLFEHNGNNWVEVADTERPGDYLTESDEAPKFKIFPELINKDTYVQNEEQTESNLWQETRESASSLSQEDYQHKVQEANIREIIAKINSGEIRVEDLSDFEAAAIAEHLRNEAETVSKILKKENNDSQDNTNQST